jgi:pseudomonalisin
MSRYLRRSTLAVLTVALAACGLAPAAGAKPSVRWTATRTQALSLAGKLLGPTSAGQRLEISAVLPLRHQSSINALIEKHTILTPAQVRSRFSPTAGSAKRVEIYLRSQGFTNLSVARNRLLVTGSATAAQAERAFHTSLSTYRLSGRSVYANTKPASVPAQLKGLVRAVLGLSDPPVKPQLLNIGAPDLSGFSPQAVQHAYDADTMTPGSGTTVAVIASGDMTPIIANLRFAEQQWKLPQVPVAVRYDGPPNGIINNNPLTGNAEWDLDTQYSTMVAQSVKKLIVYDVATFTDPEVARGLNMFVSDDTANALSASLGECDYIAWFDGAMLTTDEILAEGALQGQSTFASTGDNGYACPLVASSGLPEGPPGVSWPADGEYTTAVGGTTLLADSSGNVQSEIAWVGGGGGVSPFETAPPWTLQANGAGQVWQFTNQGGRSVPDVAAVADSTTPVLVYTSNTPGTQPEGVGGTSVSSPVTLGLWARIMTAHGNKAGLASLDFYNAYDKVNPATVVQDPLGPAYVPNANPQPVPGFRDITLGTNGGCVAKAGYDTCTGIGSLQAAAFSANLGAL